MYIYMHVYTHIHIHLHIYGEGIFLTLWTSTLDRKFLFFIICYVLLYSLFLYYTVSIMKLLLCLTGSSIIETLKAWWKSARVCVSFIVHMRKTSTLCISEEKAVHHYVNLIVRVFEENSEITQEWGSNAN